MKKTNVLQVGYVNFLHAIFCTKKVHLKTDCLCKCGFTIRSKVDKEFYHLLKKEVSNVLNHLKDRQMLILKSRFGLDCPKLTLKQTGEIFSVSGTRVQQIESLSLRLCRHSKYGQRLLFLLNSDYNIANFNTLIKEHDRQEAEKLRLAQELKQEELDRLANSKVEDLYLSDLKFNKNILWTLHGHGILTVRELLKLSVAQLSDIRGFGPISVAKIIEVLQKYSLNLTGDV